VLGIIFFTPVATGFLVGYFVPTRIMVMCLVPVAVLAVNIVVAMVMHDHWSLLGVLIGIVIAYPTAFSINRFMHD
jgi:cytochrome c oxidase subunit IV